MNDVSIGARILTALCVNGKASSAYSRWLGKFTVRVAWLALIVAVMVPVKGIGISLCWMRGVGLPCPGCGLMRSLSCAVRGMFKEGWQYHPFGPLILALFATAVLISFLPESLRARLEAAMNARSSLFDAIFTGFVIAFIVFGLLRAFLQLAHVCYFTV
jgi:hypothetical protein